MYIHVPNPLSIPIQVRFDPSYAAPDRRVLQRAPSPPAAAAASSSSGDVFTAGAVWPTVHSRTEYFWFDPSMVKSMEVAHAACEKEGILR